MSFWVADIYVAFLFASETRALNYADGSFTKYLFYLRKFEYDPRQTKIRMQIRTRDPNGGILMYTSGSEEGRFSSLEVTISYIFCYCLVFFFW